MASTYTDIGTELMTTGENAGNWGTKTNTNLKIIEEAVRGYVAVGVASADATLSLTDGTTGDSIRNAVIAFTGALAGNRIITVPAVEKMWVMDNQTTEAYTLTVKASGQTGVTWGASDKGTKILYANGTDVIDTGITSAGAFDLDGGSLTLDADADTDITADTDDQIDIKVGGTDRVRITTGAIAPSSADGIALGTSALEFSDLFLADSSVIKFGADQDTTLTHTDGTGLTLNSTNKLCFYDTALYIHSSTDGQLDLVADTEIQIAATTIDINGAVALNGAITGATDITLSGELDAATLDISGNADIDGTLEADAITINSTAIGSIYGVIAGSSSIVTTGALDSGSITSGFGTIDTGSSTITTTGLISGGSLDIDNVLINGTTIGHTDDTDLITVADGALTVAGTIGSGAITSTGIVTGTAFTAGSAVLAEAELELLDGLTAGTAIASKVVTTDSSIDTTGQRNLTISGELDAATLDISGNADIDGTLEADAITINSTAIGSIYGVIAGSSSILTTGALDTGSITSGFGAIDNGTSNIRSATITAETAFVPDASGGADLGTTALEFNDAFFNDSAVINFGDDQDTTLTHTDGTGLTLNSTNKLCFNDASQFIQGASATVLDIAATDEIELTATTVDVVGAFDVTGTSTVVALTATGLVTAGAKIDLNGTELILDADADTSITADTDDTIDIRIAGADDFEMTANTFTILSGSTIAIAAGGAITNAGSMAPDITSTGKALVFGF